MPFLLHLELEQIVRRGVPAVGRSHGRGSLGRRHGLLLLHLLLLLLLLLELGDQVRRPVLGGAPGLLLGRLGEALEAREAPHAGRGAHVGAGAEGPDQRRLDLGLVLGLLLRLEGGDELCVELNKGVRVRRTIYVSV